MIDPRGHVVFYPANSFQTNAVKNHKYQAIPVFLTIRDATHGQTPYLYLNTQILLLFLAQRRDKSDELYTTIDLQLSLQV